MDKFIIACMIFSFISGAYFVELIETHHERDKGCVVKFIQNKETIISMGHTIDE